MVLKYNIEYTLSEVYHLISDILIILIILAVLIFILIKFKLNIRFLKKTIEFSEKHKKKIEIISLFVVLVLIIILVIVKINSLILDKSTSVKVDEKIMIIEIDDYWNIKDTSDYFEKYGYTRERYTSVSDIIDKYGFTATLGVTPYIFVEEQGKNYHLKDDRWMVRYLNGLKEKGYELAMHGYNHCRNENYCPKYEEVWYNVYKGKEELQKTFKIPFTTYFPPGNCWTTEQYENVKRAGFLVIGNTHVPKAYFDEEVIITPKGYDPIYVYEWYALDFRHTSYKEWIKEYEKNNLFILQLHANTFDSQEKLDDLDKFLEYVKEDEAKVMTYREFYNYINNKIKSKHKSTTGKIILEVK
ncbi:MAG: Polysaccharide deacetylase [Candidatus Diapherotrites archaeon ADurb.Bin253]|nr:MAG: Polysaccharide deacetylase [Candidatus Diapherotrites archaeon ADurb.Bin253]